MKVYIGPYRDRWTCQVHYDYMNKKYDYQWDENQTRYESFLEKVEDVLQWVYDHSINLIIDKLGYQKTKIRIDRCDTWSMDHTLAPIILPMLKQLKETKHGAPYVDPDDCPKDLRPKEQDEYGTDDTHFARWDWVLDEMIWAFEQKCRDDWMEDYYGPWIKNKDGKKFGGHFEWTDDEGRKAHQERMSNGFKLFGKYYENLWD